MKTPRLVFWKPGTMPAPVARFLRRPAFDPAAEATAAAVLADVRARGSAAVLAWTRKFDGARLDARRLRVTPGELATAARQVDAAFRRAVREAERRIRRFAEAGLRRAWTIPTPRGGRVGEVFRPYDRIGVYVPGGAAPLASTALMTATLARVAGVPEIVACTPCRPDGQVNPHLLHALVVAGATEIYRVGGIQAIGMMAFGAGPVRAVQKIVGPGGAYVTAAKRQVYGYTALDLVAGPSEIAVLADDSAKPEHVAMDLLSQVEHGTGHEKALLATPCEALARAVLAALPDCIARLGRRDFLRRVVGRNVLLAVTPDLAGAAALCNAFAPEHLELAVRRPAALLRRIRCAGAVFLGHWTPESAGDFVAGPSHVLPTGGAAAMFAGLTVNDFQRRVSVVSFTRADLRETLPVIETFGRVEGLDAHAESARVRFAAAGRRRRGGRR